MTQTSYDIVGIGAAIVDILAYQDTAFLAEHGLAKGTMKLIDEAESASLYKQLGTATECSGGAAANTIAGYGLLCDDALSGEGAAHRAAFMGKVKDDAFGKIFTKSLRRAGVDFLTPPATGGTPTGSCLVMVTEEPNPYGSGRPKIERTMATHLGAAITLTKDDIDADIIRQAKLLFLEGYLWDGDNPREAAQYAISIAKDHGVKVAFSLSDPLCVDRHRDAFRKLVNEDIDLLFGNEHEIEALYQEKDVRKILYKMSEKISGQQLEMAAITRSEKGSYIVVDGKIYTIEPTLVDQVYDVTGAGDLYASGVLYGYLNGLSHEAMGKLGSLCATEVIKYLGGRPMSDLHALLPKVS